MTNLWTQLAAAAHLPLAEAQIQRLDRYLHLLLQANRSTNLTRITGRDEARLLHIADALTLLPHLPAVPHRLADVGSGGGVPGIPLAIARPDISVTLIESTKKKAAFLQQTAGELGLTNVRVLGERAEKLAGLELFEVVTARAVAPLDELMRWCWPLVAPGGVLLAMKGRKAAEEVESARAMAMKAGAEEPIIESANAPGLEGHVIVKVGRMAGTR